MLRRFRTPLVIFTPKSLLRMPRSMSLPDDLAAGRFQTLIDDPVASQAPGGVRRIALCSGKLYYELLEERLRLFGDSGVPVALVRVEQLYPWPEQRILEVVEAFPAAQSVCWAQEEPANMGAWTFVRERIQGVLRPAQRLLYAGRRESASVATGSLRIHGEEQAALVAAVFAGLD
jgi:2-oxoglutarate dehydrogenase E1 component